MTEYLEGLRPRPPSAPKHASLIRGIAEGFAPEIFKFVKTEVARAVGPLLRRIDALEVQAKAFQYTGTFETGKQYVKGNFVTHSGSLWHATSDTQSTPGDGAGWTLCCKRGRDGIDAPAAREARSIRSHR